MNTNDEEFHIKLIDLLEKHEGVRYKPYVDTVGKITIGVGRNLTDVGLSQLEVLELLKNDIARCILELQNIFPDFESYSDNQRLALIDMIFNLGLPRFMQFKKMIEAIKNNDFKKASDEMLDSKWATQVKNRVVELACMMDE